MHMATKAKISLFLLLAGLSVASSCATQSPHCMTVDMSTPVGQWRYVGKVGSTGDTSASGVERPAQFEFRADGTFTAIYEPPLPSELSAATLTGTWGGGKRCAGSLLSSGTQVATTPGIPRTSVILIEHDSLILYGVASGFFSAQYERGDRPATGAAVPPPTVAGEVEDTPMAPSATPTPGVRKPTPNPWRGRWSTSPE